MDARICNKPDYWLQMLHYYAPHSPVILVLNKMDENPQADINFEYYRKLYPNIYNNLFKISCLNMEYCMTKIMDIRLAISKIITENMESLAPVWDTSWFSIQKEILDIPDIMKRKDYDELCMHYGIDYNEGKQLLDILNNHGICSTFDDSDILINPNWLFKFLYLLFDDHNITSTMVDYENDFLPIISDLPNYSRYKSEILQILEQRNICKQFYKDDRKMIYFPINLDERCPISTDSEFTTEIEILLQSKTNVEFVFNSWILKEFETFAEYEWIAWKYGFIIKQQDIYLSIEIEPNAIRIIINNNQSFITWDWLLNCFIKLVPNNFFEPYIIIRNHEQTGKIELRTLELLYKKGVHNYYVLDESGTDLIMIDVEEIYTHYSLFLSKKIYH